MIVDQYPLDTDVLIKCTCIGGVTAQQQKNNLVFYGIAPDPLEV
jgi:hypothetical protein